MSQKKQRKTSSLPTHGLTPANKPLIEVCKLEVSNPRPPTAAEIRTALDALVSLLATKAAGEIPVSAGDIFVCYDIKLATADYPVFSMNGQIQMKEVLTETGVASAPEVVDMQLLDLMRPLKNKAMSWINDKLQEVQDGIIISRNTQ